MLSAGDRNGLWSGRIDAPPACRTRGEHVVVRKGRLDISLTNPCRAMPWQRLTPCLYLWAYCGIGTANPQHDIPSPIEEAHMRRQLTTRVVVATATLVTMIATLGAPFKWAMMRHAGW